jgi:hypothetical protein
MRSISAVALKHFIAQLSDLRCTTEVPLQMTSDGLRMLVPCYSVEQPRKSMW